MTVGNAGWDVQSIILYDSSYLLVFGFNQVRNQNHRRHRRHLLFTRNIYERLLTLRRVQKQSAAYQIKSLIVRSINFCVQNGYDNRFRHIVAWIHPLST